VSDEPSEGTPIGHLLKLHREQLGLTQHALATRLVSSSSSYIGLIENGLQHIGRRSMALRLAVALELDPYATDHFLQVAGFAPRLDWQAVARDLLRRGGRGNDFIRLTQPYYDALPPTQTRGVSTREP
jgi:transcriptional regulator with XRE-family HTH domain